MAEALDRHRWMEFPSRDMLAEALAARVAGALQGAIDAEGDASLAVSGGTTPALFLETLAKQEIEWRRVAVTLADERFVPPDDKRSNQRLVQEKLLCGAASEAQFVPLYRPAGTVDEAAGAASPDVEGLKPLDVAVLGMGTDGHTASFFPDAPNLPELLENEGGRAVLPVVAPSAGEPRLTLSMQLLGQARLVVLHIEGAEKRRALSGALEADAREAPPVRALFETATEPVYVYWAP